MLTAQISEIFKSHQGEGLWQAKKQAFIRFFGCNLVCSYCDTKINFYCRLKIKDVLSKIESLGQVHSVSLTGGEPLLQLNFLKELCRQLKKNKKIIYLETNGTLSDHLGEVINFIDLVAIDFKLPSSTGQGPFWASHENFLRIAQKSNVFVKVVIGRKTDLFDLDKTIKIIKKIKPDLFLVLQPENPYEEELKAKMNVFQKRCESFSLSVKIIPQLHKQIGIK